LKFCEILFTKSTPDVFGLNLFKFNESVVKMNNFQFDRKDSERSKEEKRGKEENY